jgi:hypothetical protein
MAARNTILGRTRFSPGVKKRLCRKCEATTAQSERRTNENSIMGGFHLPVCVDNKMRTRKRVKHLQKSPQGRLITAVEATTEIRPKKVEQGRRILQCNDAELEEKLLRTVERVLEELSHTG